MYSLSKEDFTAEEVDALVNGPYPKLSSQFSSARSLEIQERSALNVRIRGFMRKLLADNGIGGIGSLMVTGASAGESGLECRLHLETFGGAMGSREDSSDLDKMRSILDVLKNKGFVVDMEDLNRPYIIFPGIEGMEGLVFQLGDETSKRVNGVMEEREM